MAVQFKDYYQILGVTRTASADEIKQAFRKLARVHHPDVAKNKAAGEVKFKEINEAYEVLGDPEKKKRYDEMGPNWQDGAPGTTTPQGFRRGRTSGRSEPDFEFGGTGFSDFFESFFSERENRSRSSPRRGGGRGIFEEEEESAYDGPGRDIEADLLVTLEEVLHGAQRKVTLRRPEMDGAPARDNTYQVRIPPNLREGAKIRLAGQGGPGQGGAPAGDLYLRIKLGKHPDFTVKGDDLHCDLDLTPWEAVLGTKAVVPTLDKTVNLRIAPSTQEGTQLRVRQMGLPRDDGTRGDLYALIKIKIPSHVTPEEHALWEKLAGLSSFNPREKP